MIVALSGLCVLVYGLQTVVPCAECTLPPPPPPPHQKKVYSAPPPPPPPPQKRTEGSLYICRDDSVSTFSEFILLMQTHKILTAGIGRLIRILFISNRSDVWFISKVLPGGGGGAGGRPPNNVRGGGGQHTLPPLPPIIYPYLSSISM